MELISPSDKENNFGWFFKFSLRHIYSKIGKKEEIGGMFVTVKLFTLRPSETKTRRKGEMNAGGGVRGLKSGMRRC